MSAKPRAIDARIAELEKEITDYDTLALAGDGRELAARVSAKSKATALRKELSQIRASLEVEKIRDPVRRLELLRQGAVADGSWIAAGQLGRQVEDAKAKQLAEREAKKAAAKKDPKRLVAKLQDLLHRMPEALREEVLAPFRPE